LKICFIVASASHGGIYRVVSSLSEELKKNGNDVSIYCNIPSHSFFNLKYASKEASFFKLLHRNFRILLKIILIEIFGGLVYKKKLSKMYKVNSNYYTFLKRPKFDSETIYIFSNNWYQYFEFNDHFTSQNNTYLLLPHPEYKHLKSDYKELVKEVYKNNSIKKITISEAMEAEFFNFGCKFVGVLPLGVNHKIFNNNLGIQNRLKHILLYFSQDPRKNGVNGLDALKKIKGNHPDLKFSILSDCIYKFPDWCNTYNSISDQNLSKLYQSVDIFIYPSVYEGFGLPPLEAMSCSTAVIISSTGEAKKYAIHSKNVMLLDKGDANEIESLANQLISDEILTNKLKKNGLETSANYTWGNSAYYFENEIIG
jgi:glycosyltransferase involved in cell wall biosynthesis